MSEVSTTMSIKRGDVIGFNAARGAFAFTMRVDTRDIIIQVTDDFLQELCRRGFVECASREEAFKILRSPIETVFLRKLQSGLLESDGSVFIGLAGLKSSAAQT